jgi:hypothetical protein
MCASCHSFDGCPRKDLDYVLPPVSNYARQRLLYQAPLAPVFPRSSCYLHNRTPYSAACIILAFSASSDDVPPSTSPPLCDISLRLIKRAATTLSSGSLSLLPTSLGRLSNNTKTGAFLRTLLSCQTIGAPQLSIRAPSQARKNHADPRLERA